MQIKAYADSSYDEHKGVAGIGIVIICGEKRKVYSAWIKAHSNNEGELFAIYLAGILTSGQGIVYTDSQTALAYIRREIKGKPRTREQYIRHKHCELVAYKIRRLGVKAEKIKAHSKTFQTHAIGNNLADLLAKEGRAKFYER